MASFCFHLLLLAHLSLTPRVSTLFFLSQLAMDLSLLCTLSTVEFSSSTAWGRTLMFPDANSSIIFTEEQDVVN